MRNKYEKCLIFYYIIHIRVQGTSFNCQHTGFSIEIYDIHGIRFYFDKNNLFFSILPKSNCCWCQQAQRFVVNICIMLLLTEFISNIIRKLIHWKVSKIRAYYYLWFYYFLGIFIFQHKFEKIIEFIKMEIEIINNGNWNL